MARLLAILCLGLGLWQTYRDYQATTAQSAPFRFADAGSVWFELHKNSLQLIQPALERHIAEFLWDPVMLTILTTPLAPILFGLTIVFWLFRRRRKKR